MGTIDDRLQTIEHVEVDKVGAVDARNHGQPASVDAVPEAPRQP